MIQGRFVVQRVGWGLADQALSSFTNFALGIAVAQVATPEQFGAYGLVFSAYLMAINVTRPIAIEPLLIRSSGKDDATWTRQISSAAGTVLALGLGLGLLALVIGLTQSGSFGESVLVLGLLLPGLVLQDAWRLVLFGMRRGSTAFVNDLVWTGTLIPILAFLAITGQATSVTLIAAWGISANIAAIVGVIQVRTRPRPFETLAWWRANHDLARPLLGDRIATNIVGEFVPYAIGAIAGLAAVGALRAAQLLLGPFGVLYQGLALIALPEAVRIIDRPRRTLLRIATAYSGGLVVLVLAVGGVLWLVPESLGRLLLGDNWLAGHDVLLPYALAIAAIMSISGPAVGLRALGEARATFRVGVIRSTLAFIGAVTGAALGGAPAAALGMAIGHGLGAVETWREFLRAVDRRGAATGASRLPSGGPPEADRI